MLIYFVSRLDFIHAAARQAPGQFVCLIQSNVTESKTKRSEALEIMDPEQHCTGISQLLAVRHVNKEVVEAS